MLTSLASRGLLPGLRETWASGRLLNVPHRRRLAAGLRAQILLSRCCRCRCPAPMTLGKQPWPPLRPLGHSCCQGRGGVGGGGDLHFHKQHPVLTEGGLRTTLARGLGVLRASPGFYTGDLRGCSWAGFLLSSRSFTSVLLMGKGGRLCRDGQGNRLYYYRSPSVYPRLHAH